MENQNKLSKSQLKRQRIIEYHSKLIETCNMTLAVERTAKKFDLTESRIYQILRTQSNETTK